MFGDRPQNVAGAKIERETGDVERCGRAFETAMPWAAPQYVRQRLLEARAGLSLGQPVRRQDVPDRIDVVGGDILAPVGDHWTAILLNSLISATSRKCSFLPELYSKASDTASPRSPIWLVR